MHDSHDIKPIPIYILAWHRMGMTERCLREIAERTRYPHEVHVYVNSAWEDDVEALLKLAPYYTSIHLDKRNTCVWYPKFIAHAMTTVDTPYYVLNDQDYYPPQLSGPCWLERLVRTMEEYSGLGVLAAQLPPQSLQGPIGPRDGYIVCRAVGNSLRLTRRAVWPQAEFKQELGKFGDDSILCGMIRSKGYDTGFSRDVYCLHAGQTRNWGYKPEELRKDPRKAGYGPPYTYDYDPLTYVPADPNLRM